MLKETSHRRRWGLAAIGILIAAASTTAAEIKQPSPILGRWDITVTGTITERDKDGKVLSSRVQTYPMWLGVQEKDGKLVAEFVGKGGGAREIDPPKFENGTMTFKAKGGNWTGKLKGDTIEGTSSKGDKWTARRYAPQINVSGKWNLKVGDKPIVLTLAQIETKLRGTWVDAAGKGEFVKGKLSGRDLFMRVDMTHRALQVKGDTVWGTVNGEDTPMIGTRERKWGKPIVLLDGKAEDLSNWAPLDAKELNWKIVDGVMTNGQGHTENIVTKRKDFGNFKLHVEFKVPQGGNSGVYLRGRYEIQVDDAFGKPITKLDGGALYGRITPKVNACKKPGEWQVYDITLIDNFVTVVHNGQTVIDNEEIEGITGGAIDSNEDKPGPIYLQGDHSQAFYRKIILTPEEKAR